MNMYMPIFGSGLARSGGALYSNCLSANSQMMVACCPNLELFRSYRNAIIRQSGDKEVEKQIPPSAPLQDYYGTSARIRALDMVMDAILDIPFDEVEWPSFHDISVARGALEAEDLTPAYGRLKGRNYREVFGNLLDIIADARDSHDRKWVGFHEAWAIDSYPALARAFPDAKFLIMFRDPRAIVHSMLGVESIDPAQVAHILSYVRHWRKYAALALRYKNDPLFKGRLHITAHDLILTRTEESVRAICDTFEVEFTPRMLNTDSYFDFATGRTWSGNSSFEGKTSGIKAYRALRWREIIKPEVLDVIEYLCGPDLGLVGYPTFTKYADPVVAAPSHVMDFLLREHGSYSNWRSDLGDPLADLGLEAVRRSLLTLSEKSRDRDLVRQCFLFTETYDALHEERGPLLPGLPE